MTGSVGQYLVAIERAFMRCDFRDGNRRSLLAVLRVIKVSAQVLEEVSLLSTESTYSIVRNLTLVELYPIACALYANPTRAQFLYTIRHATLPILSTGLTYLLKTNAITRILFYTGLAGVNGADTLLFLDEE